VFTNPLLGEVISTAGPNHTNCCDRYNVMAKFKLSSPLSNGFKTENIIYVYPIQCPFAEPDELSIKKTQHSTFYQLFNLAFF